MNLEAAITQLDHRFGIPDIASITVGNGGLAKVVVRCAAAVGEMYLQGAHITSWQPRGAEEVIFVSAQTRWENGRAIRGGIPICFPWFANKADNADAPMHGFVRTTAWRLDSVVQAGDAVTVNMFTESNETTKRWWPADFHLAHRATFGSELSLELVLTNTGTTSLRFEEALHTYFRVGQIENARLAGLDSVHYLDKTDLNRKNTQQGPIAIVSETDRVYLNTRQTVELDDHALGRRIIVAKENSLTTVVWNPWSAKAKALADFGDDEWKQMICIETSNVAAFAVDLAPGKQHKMRARVSVGNL